MNDNDWIPAAMNRLTIENPEHRDKVMTLMQIIAIGAGEMNLARSEELLDTAQRQVDLPDELVREAVSIGLAMIVNPRSPPEGDADPNEIPF